MAERLVISALVAKRSELAGDIAAAEAHVAALQATLAHVDATLALFDFGRDPETIPPTQRQAPRMFGFGELKRLVLDACREKPALATHRQIALEVIAAKGWDASNELLVRKVATGVKCIRTRAALRASANSLSNSG